MNRILCSTGALIGRPNGRDYRLLEECVRRLECDGFEFMMYSTWYDQADALTAFLKELSRIAFAEMGLVSLSLRVYCFNVSAIRCYENAGFRITAFFEEENSHWNNYSMELKP